MGFYLCSNLIAAIAIDRLISVRNLKNLTSGSSRKFEKKILLIFSWLFAIFCSAPNAYVYTIFYEIDEEKYSTDESIPKCFSRFYYSDDAEMIQWGDRYDSNTSMGTLG
jgi:hypothetical protein